MRTNRLMAWVVPALAAMSLGLTAQGSGLLETIKQGDIVALRVLLGQGVDVNVAQSDGTTALHWAAHRGNAEAVELLIAAGADARRANRYGVTPIALAAENGDVAVTRQLLGGGANPNAALAGGETVLMTAARTGVVGVVEALLAAGADVNAKEDTRGQTPLMWASAEGHTGAIRVLTGHGADVHTRSHAPAWQPDPTAKRLPGFYRDYSRKNRLDSFTPLLFAVRSGHVGAVHALLEAGASVNDTLEDGTSALVVAIVRAHWQLAAILLEKGADPDAGDQGWTALHQVARSRSLNVREFPHPVPTGRISSLDLAKELIGAGADVNARMTKAMRDGYSDRFNRVGATPLLLAAKGVDHELMRLLAANGADPFATNEKGTTVLMAVAGVGMTHLGIDSGSNDDALEAAKVALETGADVAAANVAGDTALHGAAGRGSTAIIELLVKAGARLDVSNERGCTPVRIANGEPGCAMLGAVRPEAFAVLRRLMAERGLPIEIRSREENVAFGVE